MSHSFAPKWPQSCMSKSYELGTRMIMSQLKTLGRYFEICLDLCQALEHRNFSRSYELELKRAIYQHSGDDHNFFKAKMQECIFDQLSNGPRSWVQHFLYLKTYGQKPPQALADLSYSKKITF